MKCKLAEASLINNKLHGTVKLNQSCVYKINFKNSNLAIFVNWDVILELSLKENMLDPGNLIKWIQIQRNTL